MCSVCAQHSRETADSAPQMDVSLLFWSLQDGKGYVAKLMSLSFSFGDSRQWGLCSHTKPPHLGNPKCYPRASWEPQQGEASM